MDCYRLLDLFQWSRQINDDQYKDFNFPISFQSLVLVSLVYDLIKNITTSATLGYAGVNEGGTNNNKIRIINDKSHFFPSISYCGIYVIGY